MNTVKKIMLVAMSICLFSACNKESGIEEIEVGVAADNLESEHTVAYAESLLADLEEEIDEAIITAGTSRSASCPTRTWKYSRGIYPNVLTIDYGQSCEGKNGRIRSGKVIIDVSDSLKNVGSTRSVSFEDYMVDSVQVMGSKTWENTGLDMVANTISIHRSADMSLSFPDGTLATWSSEHDLTKSVFLVRRAGSPSPIRIRQFAATLGVMGSSTGVNRQGVSFESEITTALHKDAACFWFGSGIRQVTKGEHTRILNYGTGACDRKAMVTLSDGSMHEVLIGPFWRKKR